MTDRDTFHEAIEIAAKAIAAEWEHWLAVVPPSDKERWTPEMIGRLQAAAIMAELGKRGIKLVRVH
ncbi:hypothetical protein [Aurantimonas endophytica]|uniref:Uncharacterized protein n=1 Tax=Aurantimonas endophytica TaxID=1522175 RepID=A0A7W6H9B3_9HYPH|nr:hypothetical protein [Aurantimonas endophytica]MBB4000983.1 hypothetical protein [Aurantimonas endophytica]MCO6403358.1 hypothetical protein [Aurantimonas endophytica]